jgi:predicted solute-binding protein
MTRRTLGISEALHLRPLIEGLDGEESPWTLYRDIPAQLSVLLGQRIPPLEAGCAFLSPIDFARHGGDYRIVPGICASSATSTRTVHLLVRQEVQAITRVAVDLRVTSEIVLLKILLLEKFPELSEPGKTLEFVAISGSLEEQVRKADAVLAVNLREALPERPSVFSLDLVEEWLDLTELPYVHGFWVAHEDVADESLITSLAEARSNGCKNLARIAGEVAAGASASSEEEILAYLSAFAYEFGEDKQDAVSEFFRYAFYHGILGDIPELKFAS